MKLPRWMSLFDIGAIVIVVLLPIMPGSIYRVESAAFAAFRGKTPPAEVRWQLVMAQARNTYAPGTLNAVNFVGALTAASFGDWAVDEAHRAAVETNVMGGLTGLSGGVDVGWREAFLVSEAYADRLEPVLALKWAKLAQQSCLVHTLTGDPPTNPGQPSGSMETRTVTEKITMDDVSIGEPCPAEWNPRLTEYIKAFEAGVASGIDPRRNPNGFRAAAESALRMIRPSAQ